MMAVPVKTETQVIFQEVCTQHCPQTDQTDSELLVLEFFTVFLILFCEGLRLRLLPSVVLTLQARIKLVSVCYGTEVNTVPGNERKT